MIDDDSGIKKNATWISKTIKNESCIAKAIKYESVPNAITNMKGRLLANSFSQLSKAPNIDFPRLAFVLLRGDASGSPASRLHSSNILGCLFFGESYLISI